MPRHSKSAAAAAAAPVDIDLGPGMDNDASRRRAPKKYAATGAKRVHEAVRKTASHHAPSPKDTSFRVGKHSASATHQGPQATSMPCAIGVIQDVQKPGKGLVGIPGIISSTTLGPEVRHRLVSGIIEHPMMAAGGDTGAVRRVLGVDSTAYNTGMVHIPGSRF